MTRWFEPHCFDKNRRALKRVGLVGKRLPCMHCEDSLFRTAQTPWVHTHGHPVDHVPCPYNINPDNWR